MLNRTTVGIHEVVAFLDRTAHHLEVLNLTDMWLDTCLEEIYRSRTSWIWNHLLTACVAHGWHLVNERNDIAKELHQSAYTHVLICADTEYRENAASSHTLADTFAHLVLCELFCLEELLHESLVVLGSSLDKVALHFLCLDYLAFRNILDSRLAAVRTIGQLLHEDDVDQLMEVVACLNRILHRDDLVAIV